LPDPNNKAKYTIQFDEAFIAKYGGDEDDGSFLGGVMRNL
jgi:hypothetical protein